NQFLRSHLRVGGAESGLPSALSEELRVQDGYELALAAARGGRLDAALVKDVAGAQALLDTAGPDGGTALLADVGPERPGRSPAVDGTREPLVGAVRLLDLLSGAPEVLELAARLLADA